MQLAPLCKVRLIIGLVHTQPCPGFDVFKVLLVGVILGGLVDGNSKPVKDLESKISPIIKSLFNLCFDKNIIFRDGYQTGYARCSINPCSLMFALECSRLRMNSPRISAN